MTYDLLVCRHWIALALTPLPGRLMQLVFFVRTRKKVSYKKKNVTGLVAKCPKTLLPKKNPTPEKFLLVKCLRAREHLRRSQARGGLAQSARLLRSFIAFINKDSIYVGGDQYNW